MDGIAYNASLHPWAFFVTLTYASKDKSGNPRKVPNLRERRAMLFAFLREASKGRKRNKHGTRIESVPFPCLLWLAREERGELGGRYHFHILLSGLPSTRTNRTECFALKSIWTGLGGGFADVRLFDTGLPGVSYVMKGLAEWSKVHANAYELSKFTEDEKDRMLILSDSCVRKWGAESKSTRALGNSRSTVITGARPLVPLSRKGRKWTKEDLEAALRGSYGLGMHPAGPSFVR